MKILLHICCGVCAAGVAERLISEKHSVTGFFYNPNIYPEEEYKKRLEAAREAAKRTGFELIEGKYEHDKWRRAISGYEDAPEGGTRCVMCFRMRLKKTYEYCLEKQFDLLTTTLTVSPLKNARVLNEIGASVCGRKFLTADFKKKDGFKKTIELSKEWGLYRQSYCGCEYSRR